MEIRRSRLSSRDPKRDPGNVSDLPHSPRPRFLRRFAKVTPGSSRSVSSRPVIRRRSSSRPTRGQWIFASIAILVVLSLVGSTLGTIFLDFNSRQGSQQEDDPQGFDDQQASLIADQRATVAANPNDASAMALLAQYLQLGGNSTEAVQWYEQALQIDPNDVSIRLNFADMLTQAERQADSELQYQRVLTIDPGNIPAVFYLGDLYQFWKPEPRTTEAIAQFEQVLVIGPDSALATTARDRLTLLGAATPVATPGAPTASTPIVAP